jgi:hypothetical protein
MANSGVPKGKESVGKGASAGSKVEFLKDGENSMGIPNGQSPGLGKGNKEVSLNQLPSNARVVKSASSHLMESMSQSRGPERKGSGQ